MTTEPLPSPDRRKRWITWSVPAAAIVIVLAFALLVPRGVGAPTTAPSKPASPVAAPASSVDAKPAVPPASPAAAASPAASESSGGVTPISGADGAAAATPNPANDKPTELAPGILVPPGRTITYIRGQGPPPTDKPGVSTSLKPAPLDQMEKQRERIYREMHGGVAPPKPTDPPRPRDPNAIEITSADPSVEWRIRGDVERSLTRGESWAAIPTGRGRQLTGGDSPNRSLCWVVGRAGLVMRTTDGRTWETLTFPEKTDLKSIAAFDANYAIVTTADGRDFRTNDGGATWRR